ncbi:MAG TPA: hypothetical protein VFP12_03485 [Allosphingosinicella sp.]|nr:hypothetical protein [Allosphingosinicella sp.]
MKRSTMLGAMMLCACGQSGPPEGNASTDIARGPGAEAQAARTDLVPDFPGSTPVEIPNLGVPGTDSRSGNAMARETDAGPDQVAAFYREHFRKSGIPVRADTANAAGGLISVARDGERGAMVTISRIGHKTRIAVLTGPR